MLENDKMVALKLMCGKHPHSVFNFTTWNVCRFSYKFLEKITIKLFMSSNGVIFLAKLIHILEGSIN